MADQKPKAIIYELDRYSLFAPVENNKRASLNWCHREGYPRITVFTRTPSDNDSKGVINAALDLDIFLIFIQRLERVARTEGEQKEKVVGKHWPRDAAGKITGDKEPTSEIWYGKNSEGVVWISVHAVGPVPRPKIAFNIELSDYSDFYNSKGDKLSKAEGSVARTLAMCTVLKQVFIDKLISFRDTSIRREPTAPYSQRGNTSGGKSEAYSSATESISSMNMDDMDIPY